MPSVSSLLPDDKARIKRSIPGGNKILTATVARIFYQQGHEWDYSGIQGGLCLVVDKQRGGVWWKVVDLLGTRGIIWEHELPTSSTWSYNQDRGFFHSFPSEETNVAFVFADESEAGEMYKKVQGRGKYNKTKSAKTPAAASSSSSSKRKKGGKIDKSMISGPSDGSFKHLAHMGYTSELGFSSSGVDPSWQALLDSLGNKGISTKQIMENEGFIREFVQKEGGVPPAQPKKRTPPPAPTSKRKAPPPPPVSRSATTAGNAPPPPPSRPVSHAPPPPPPARPSAPPQQQEEDYYEAPPPPSRGAPPAPPSRPSAPALPSRGAAPPPPPPPPPGRPAPPTLPSRGGAPPPPPPPRPSGGGDSAPPSPAGDLPQVTPPRANLMASIQGAGLHKLKSSSGAPAAPSGGLPAPPTSAYAAAAVGAGAVGAGAAAVAVADDAGGGGGGGGDLASALASALSQRKGNMGDSDDEESDEEWD